MPKFGFSHVYKAKTSSSNRTVATLNRLNHKKKLSEQRKRKDARSLKKRKKITELPVIKSAVNSCIAREVLAEFPHFFSLDLTNSAGQGRLVKSLEAMQLFEGTDGAVHWMDKERELFSSLLIPRKRVLQVIGKSGKNTKKAIKALDCLQQTEKSCHRSELKSGVMTTDSKYVIYGSKVRRGSTGFSRDKLRTSFPFQAKHLDELSRRCACVASEFLSSHLLRGMSDVTKAGCWESLSPSVDFVAALASAKNYMAPAHVDEDFLFSIHQLNVNMDKVYDVDNSVVQYFCFPEFGYAIGLRPGDMMIFNPQVYHCLSEKQLSYCSLDVHVTTFYVKTAHVGKNDNSLPLTDEEEMYHKMKFT
jgi:hypothetical protein